MTTLHQLAAEYTDRVNRDSERKKRTISKLVRFAWGLFSYYKGTTVVEGDLASATSQVAIQALSKQMTSGFQDVKLDAVAIEGIDLVTGWVMDLIRPSEMQLESQLGMLAMARGLAGPTMMPMGMPTAPPPAYAMPQPIQTMQPMIPPPGYAAPRPPLVGPPGTYGGSYIAPRMQTIPFTGRIANQDGTWVYVANDG